MSADRSDLSENAEFVPRKRGRPKKVSGQETRNLLNRKKVAWTGDIKDFGFVRPPVTWGQFDQVMAARRFVMELKCYDRIRDMMQRDRPMSEIFEVVRIEGTDLSDTSATKYLTIFKSFFFVEAQLAPILPGISTAEVLKDAMPTKGRIEAVEALANLEELRAVQMERVRCWLNLEKKLAGSAMSGKIRLELLTAQALCEAELRMKMDMGRIARAPVEIDANVHLASELTDQGRVAVTKLVEFVGNALDRVLTQKKGIPGEVIDVTHGRK